MSPGNNAHISAFQTEMLDDTGAKSEFFICILPRNSRRKNSLAAEEKSGIFSFAHLFMNRERGSLHTPVFTLLEWYRAGAPYQRLIEDCMGLLARTVAAAGSRDLRFGGHVADPFEEPEILTVAEAFDRFAGIDLLATLKGPEPDRAALAAAARNHGLRIVADDSWSDIGQQDPGGEDRAGNSAMAARRSSWTIRRARQRARQIAGRHAFRVSSLELYACGVELANGFGELNDPGATAAAVRNGNGGEAQDLWRGLSDRRGFLAGSRDHARG